jgi:multiple sugar transport system permease protein
VIWLHLFNDSFGPINQLLRPILAPLNLRPPNWFGVDVTTNPPINDAARWAVPGLVIMSLWGIGGGMIIYLAGLKGIPTSLYEAATIDGAGAMRKFWNVTLPMLSPLIFYNVVMGVIASYQVFTQAYVMTGPGPDNATLFYVLNLYRQAFVFHNMGYASAMAWVLFLIVLVMTILIFRSSRKLVYYEGLKA